MKRTIFTLLLSLLWVTFIQAQTTEFTYQGRLLNSSLPATGNFDFEFSLFDAVSGGNQLGTTLTRSNIPVNSGIFTVKLDFGDQFSGADRFLEIKVRTADVTNPGPFSSLSPRQPFTSTPYAIKSKTAVNFTGPLGGDMTGTQNAVTVVGIRGKSVSSTPPQPNNVLIFDGLSNQWQPQALPASGGTITGVTAGTGLTGGGSSGTVIIGIGNGGINTAQLAPNSVSDSKIVSVDGSKITGPVSNALNATQLGGIAAGQFVVTTDTRLSNARNPLAGSGFYIQNSTTQQTSGNFNISGTGKANVFDATGQYNIGGQRILAVSGAPGNKNIFVGTDTGQNNTTGSRNSFFGNDAGRQNTTGSNNTFAGRYTGQNNISGNNNSFFGFNAGPSNTTGSNNAYFGTNAGLNNLSGSNNTVLGSGADLSNGLSFATAVGSTALVTASNTIQLGRNGQDVVRIGKTGAAGSTDLCLNSLKEISVCSSSIRYKTDIRNFNPGIAMIKQLRPVSFKWKAGGLPDLGLVAEEVAEIEPLLATYNEKGQVEGVKYDRIGIVLLNAVREQQSQIESQQKQIKQQSEMLKQQQNLIESLKKLTCAANPTVAICRNPEEK